MSSLDWRRDASTMCGEGESLGVPPQSESDRVLEPETGERVPNGPAPRPSSVAETSSGISASTSGILDNPSMLASLIRVWHAARPDSPSSDRLHVVVVVVVVGGGRVDYQHGA